MGEAESVAPGSGVERSVDETQRKAAESAAVDAGIAVAAKKLRNEVRVKRNAFVIYFYMDSAEELS